MQSRKLCEVSTRNFPRITPKFCLKLMIDNWMENRMNIDIPYNVVEICELGGPNISPGSIIFYTDGPKMK